MGILDTITEIGEAIANQPTTKPARATTAVAASTTNATVSSVVSLLTNSQSVISQAIAAFNDPNVENKIVDVATLALELEKIAAIFDPAIVAAEVPTQLLITALPFIFKMYGLVVNFDANSYTLTSAAWQANPRERLNPDGTFVDGNLFPF